LISSALLCAEKPRDHAVARGDRGFLFALDAGELGEVNVNASARRRPSVSIEREGRQSFDAGVVDYAPSRWRRDYQPSVATNVDSGGNSPGRCRYPAVARMSEVPVDPTLGLDPQGVYVTEELTGILDTLGAVTVDYDEARFLSREHSDLGIGVPAPEFEDDAVVGGSTRPLQVGTLGPWDQWEHSGAQGCEHQSRLERIGVVDLSEGALAGPLLSEDSRRAHELRLCAHVS